VMNINCINSSKEVIRITIVEEMIDQEEEEA
jgi:hypothetical protein